jgi:dynein heavy chain, axonemal
MDTQEWSDGVLAIKIRDAAESESIDRKWIIFDGPVDAVWIENMNTVLDDNKKLCLNSGQIIKLKPTMTIMFEVDDLSQASPATVSRCGMVLLESRQLGHSVFINSYCHYLKSIFEEKTCDKLEKYFHYVVDLCVEFTRVNCRFPCPGNGAFVVRLIECYVKPYKKVFADQEDIKIPGDIDDKMLNALIFATIWGIGGCIDEFTREKFDEFFQEVIVGENVIDKYKLDMGEQRQDPMKVPNKMGEYKSLFEIYFDQDEMKWINWFNTVDKYIVDKDLSYL